MEILAVLLTAILTAVIGLLAWILLAINKLQISVSTLKQAFKDCRTLPDCPAQKTNHKIIPKEKFSPYPLDKGVLES
jgi:hypothetical protein